jgi:hypothetical protein
MGKFRLCEERVDETYALCISSSGVWPGDLYGSPRKERARVRGDSGARVEEGNGFGKRDSDGRGLSADQPRPIIAPPGSLAHPSRPGLGALPFACPRGPRRGSSTRRGSRRYRARQSPPPPTPPSLFTHSPRICLFRCSPRTRPPLRQIQLQRAADSRLSSPHTPHPTLKRHLRPLFSSICHPRLSHRRRLLAQRKESLFYRNGPLFHGQIFPSNALRDDTFADRFFYSLPADFLAPSLSHAHTTRLLSSAKLPYTRHY